MADASAGTMRAAMSTRFSLVENVNGGVRTSGPSGAIWEPTRSPNPFEATRDHDSPAL